MSVDKADPKSQKVIHWESARGGRPPWELLVKKAAEDTMQAIATAAGCPPEPDGKILLSHHTFDGRTWIN